MSGGNLVKYLKLRFLTANLAGKPIDDDWLSEVDISDILLSMGKVYHRRCRQ